jgi:hypothetical protein
MRGSGRWRAPPECRAGPRRRLAGLWARMGRGFGPPLGGEPQERAGASPGASGAGKRPTRVLGPLDASGGPSGVALPPKECEGCGGLFAPTPRGGASRQRFCSVPCRSRAEGLKRRARKRAGAVVIGCRADGSADLGVDPDFSAGPGPDQRPCEECGALFAADRRGGQDRRFCSGSCRKRAGRRRQAEAAGAKAAQDRPDEQDVAASNNPRERPAERDVTRGDNQQGRPDSPVEPLDPAPLPADCERGFRQPYHPDAEASDPAALPPPPLPWDERPPAP